MVGCFFPVFHHSEVVMGDGGCCSICMGSKQVRRAENGEMQDQKVQILDLRKHCAGAGGIIRNLSKHCVEAGRLGLAPPAPLLSSALLCVYFMIIHNIMWVWGYIILYEGSWQSVGFHATALPNKWQWT